MPTLYVVRHAEPAIKGVLLGRTDPPLSEHGIMQAASLRLPTSEFFSSTLRRAKESARLCAHGAPVVAMQDLDEISLGDWDGLAWTEIESRWPGLAALKLQDWFGVTPPGGEPWPVFTSRVDEALDRLLSARHSIAIVAHLTVNAWIAHRIAGLDPLTFQQQYAEYSEYVF